MEMTMTRPIRLEQARYALPLEDMYRMARSIEGPAVVARSFLPNKKTPGTEGEGFQGPEQSGGTDDAA